MRYIDVFHFVIQLPTCSLIYGIYKGYETLEKQLSLDSMYC